MSVLQQLHDSEINGSISSFYDGVWTVRLGDDMNGYKEECIVSTYTEAEKALVDLAIKHYPNSKFALSWADKE